MPWPKPAIPASAQPGALNRLAWRAGVVLALIVAIVVIWLGWRLRLPRTVRLLPAGQAVGYLNFRLLRRGQWLNQVSSSPNYARFEQKSGFYYRRDLTSVALSLRPAPPHDIRATALLEGHFSQHFHAYLRHAAIQTWQLSGRRYLRLAGMARPVVVTWLNPGLLAVSNGPTPASLAPVLRKWHGWLPARAPGLACNWSSGWFPWLDPAAGLRLALRPPAWPQIRKSPALASALLPIARLEFSIRPLTSYLQLRMRATTGSTNSARMLAQNWRRWKASLLARPANESDLARFQAVLSGVLIRTHGRAVTLLARIPYTDLQTAPLTRQPARSHSGHRGGKLIAASGK